MYELNKGRSSLISNTQFNINFKPKKDFIGMDYGLNIHQAEKEKYITYREKKKNLIRKSLPSLCQDYSMGLY
jgi:hypothetical protein